MKAIVYHGRKDVRYQNVAEPLQIGPHEVRLKVKYAGLCHTDFNEYLHGPLFIAQTPHPRTGRSIPIVIGHEFSGEVLEIGKQVDQIRVGDHVAVNAVDSCGHCTFCRRGTPSLCTSVAYIGFARDGGFAEYAVVPARCCFRLKPEMSCQAGALVEPLAVALHAVRQARVPIGSRAAVVGGGAIGLCTLQALRATGMLDVLVIDKAKAKEPFARQMGASAFLDPADPDLVRTVRELTDGIGVDVAFECVGSPVALRTAVEVTGGGGTICVAGIFPAPFEFDLNTLLMQEKSIVTSLGYSDEFPVVIAMLADGRLAAEPLITRTVSLAEGVEMGLNKYEDISVTNIRTLIRIES
jgi:(R,R)-butanediol dehydrogenase / meso-butanediol dehydrogenase / diacetyl reductase